MKEADGFRDMQNTFGLWGVSSQHCFIKTILEKINNTRSGYKTCQGRVPPLSIHCSINIKSTVFGWIVAKCKIENVTQH